MKVKTPLEVRVTRPNLEALEARDLPCGISLLPGGVVLIDGTNAPDGARVSPLGAGTLVRLDCGNDGVTDHVAAFPPGLVTRVVFLGHAGNDGFVNETSLPSEAHGGHGNDDLHGGTGADKLYGDDGNDCLCGNAGDDWMFGGAGADLLHGWAGNDHLFGEAGADRLVGGDGNDHLDGGTGPDLLKGSAGDDHLDGGVDADVDWLFGGAGADVLVWRAGDLRDWVNDGPFVPPC